MKQIKYYIPLETKIILENTKCEKFDFKIREMVQTNKEKLSVDFKNIDESKSRFSRIKDKLSPLIKKNKGKTVIVGSLILVVTGYGIYCINRNPKYVKSFKSSLDQYFKEIQEGSLKKETLESLLYATIKYLGRQRFYKKYVDEYFEAIENCIAQYTTELFEKNDTKLRETDISKSENRLLRIAYYLGEQERLFFEESKID